MAITLTVSARNVMCDALVDALDLGGGASQVTICEADNTVLSTHNLTTPNAFGDAVSGVATANTIDDAVAGATGTAAKCRWYDRGGRLLFEGTVDTSAADMIINSTAISSGVTISIEGGDGGGTLTVPAS